MGGTSALGQKVSIAYGYDDVQVSGREPCYLGNEKTDLESRF